VAQERWATFDCYGTLIDWDGGIGDCLTGLFPDEPRQRLLEIYHRIEPQVQAERYRTYRDVMDLTMARVADELGRPQPEDETALSQSLPRWSAFPEVPAALAEAVHRGWRLAILSNCDRDLIATSLPKLGVTFDEVIVAEDVQSYKPAPGHWDRFDAETGADPAHHVHVGASLFHDVKPGNERGLATVWINRLGEPPDPPPDRELTNLSGLPDALDSLVP